MNGYVRDPMNCWTPAHFHGSHDSYANNYCWVSVLAGLYLHTYIPVHTYTTFVIARIPDANLVYNKLRFIDKFTLIHFDSNVFLKALAIHASNT